MEKTKKKLSLQTIKDVYQDMKTDTQFANDRKRWSSNIKKFIIGLFKFLILVGVSYVILGPIIGIISSSFFSDADNYNPMVYLIPQEPTLFRYEMAIEYLNYGKTVLVIFDFPDDDSGHHLFHGRIRIRKIQVSF